MGSKFLYIHTFGCQMNERDSERIEEILSDYNYITTPDVEKANLILLNTCSIRDKSEQKVFSTLGRLKPLKNKNPNLIIGLGGCIGQIRGDELLKRFPYLDFVFGTKSFLNIPKLIEEVENKKERICDISGIEDKTEFQRKIINKKVTAYVSIMTGCDKFCTFCVVPYTRGREKNRPSYEIIEEIKILALQGIKEVTLLGQTVNSYGTYGKADISFPQLLDKIDKIEQILRIRFTTSYPSDLSKELIQSFITIPKLCKHIHLPVQSGSNNVLKRMGRKYTRESYIEQIREIRKICPDISITSDIIVGFPGESDYDFEETISLLKEVEFDSIFSFKYSPRLMTPAAKFKDQVDEEIKTKRINILQKLQKEITNKKNISSLGKIEEILVEGYSKKGTNQLTGRTSGNKIVNFEGDEKLIGKLVKVKIEKVYPNCFLGNFLE